MKCCLQKLRGLKNAEIYYRATFWGGEGRKKMQNILKCVKKFLDVDIHCVQSAFLLMFAELSCKRLAAARPEDVGWR